MKQMTQQQALAVLTDELNHSRQHLNEKGKHPDFYKEYGEYVNALEVAIDDIKKIEQIKKFFITHNPMNSLELMCIHDIISGENQE